jgi:hypothetical protein
MAEGAKIPGKRSFVFILIVSIITCGIYWFYWYYKTNDEIKQYGKLGHSPLVRLLVLVFGIVLLGLPSIYIYYVWLKDVDEQAKKAGLGGLSPILHTILIIIPFGSLFTTYKVQATLNDIWDSAGPAKSRASSEQSEPQSEPAPKAGKAGTAWLRCPRCKSRNPDDSNYCIKCGQQLG